MEDGHGPQYQPLGHEDHQPAAKQAPSGLARDRLPLFPRSSRGDRHPSFRCVRRLFPDQLVAELSFAPEGQGGVGLAARQGWDNLGSTHARYALRRQGLMSWRERWELFRSSPEMYRMLVDQGVGGTTSPGGIKCLHAHYADWLMEQQNPVGAWVQGLLMSNRHLLGKYAHSCLICHGEAVSPVDGIIISPNKVQAMKWSPTRLSRAASSI